MSGKSITIWIDLENSPHVPFLLPIIRELESRDIRVLITARDCFQTCDLLDASGVQYSRIGSHYGKNKLKKIIGLLMRTMQLIRYAYNKEIDLAVSHGSRALFLGAYVLRIPCINIDDYEFSAYGPLKYFISKNLVPQALPATSVKKAYGINKTVQYPGIKEETYVCQFKPNHNILSELRIDQAKIIVTMRPPATDAHYHVEESETLFDIVFRRILACPETLLFVLCRTESQREWIRTLAGNDLIRVMMPREAIDGLSLLWFSDFVVSGGGTMNREAALLGTPAYSVFAGKTGAVDLELEQNGRMTFIRSASELNKLDISKKNHETTLPCVETKVLNFIIDEIIEAL